MKTRHLAGTLFLTLATGAAVAALNRGAVESPVPANVACPEEASSEIPRVVVTATREIPRVVVVGKRAAAPRS